MSVNIGHGDERVIRGHRRAGCDASLCQSFYGDRTAGRDWEAKLAEIAPGDIDTFFFYEMVGAEAKRKCHQGWRAFFTGRHKIMAPAIARITGATAGCDQPLRAILADGRLKPGMPGVVRGCSIRITVIERGWEIGGKVSLAMIERDHFNWKGRTRFAGFHFWRRYRDEWRALFRRNGYLEGVRKLCDKYGILMNRRRSDVGPFGRHG